jgi:hypothetical protein
VGCANIGYRLVLRAGERERQKRQEFFCQSADFRIGAASHLASLAAHQRQHQLMGQ